jgi:hypothetical protein
MRASPALLAAALCAGAVVPAARGDEPVGRVLLRWQSVPGAAGYDLQVAADAGFSRRQLDVRVELAGHRMAASWERRYWRVRAVDAEGRAGPWSAAKTIDPLRRAATPDAGSNPELAPALLDVPPLAPAAVEGTPAQGAAERPPAERVSPAAEVALPFSLGQDPGFEGFTVLDVLGDGRPGVIAGWRANLLGVTAPWLAVEGGWPLPWVGAPYSAALRAGWWRERATVPPGAGMAATFSATADVAHVAALLLRSVATPWARVYAGGGLGADLVLVRLLDEGALEASAALEVVAGLGRPFGPGETFVELSGGLGGVDGPLGRLRTGGISLSVGYRLGR